MPVTLGTPMTVAGDLAFAALQFYVKKGGLMQTTQDKPLLRILKSKQKMFPGGNNSSYGISLPVQGATLFSNEGVGMIQKYAHDEAISFYRPANLVRAEYPWYETISGLVLSGTDLKQDGISLVDDRTVAHSKAAETRLTSILKNRLDDFGVANFAAVSAIDNALAQSPWRVPGPSFVFVGLNSRTP